MALPYENATSGGKAVEDIRKILLAFGATKFGVMDDIGAGMVIIQFEYRSRMVEVKASIKGYAARWLKEHPYSYRIKGSQIEHERKALAQAAVSVYSVLRDWIKGQVTAIETQMLSFEGAFLGQILLPSGRTVLDEVQTRNLLPSLPETDSGR